MSSEEITGELKLLLTYRDALVFSLKKVDLLCLIGELREFGIASCEENEGYCSLCCEVVDIELRVRYLLNLILEKLSKDKALFRVILIILNSYGGELKRLCNLINEEYEKGVTVSARELAKIQDGERCLTENDIHDILESLVDIADKWEEISIALRIPKCVREDIRLATGSSVISKLEKVLSEWVSRSHPKPVTLSSLKTALSSQVVGEPRVADSFADTLPASKKHCLDLLYQSVSVCVCYGKSTLLEVRVNNASSFVLYQWYKDGHKLSDDGNYQGTKCSILLVRHKNMASKHVEGNYICRVEGRISSDKISVEIYYPDSIRLLLDGYKKLVEVPKDSWPPQWANSYVHLALINRKLCNVGKFNCIIREDVDDNCKKNDKVDYCQAFSRCESGALALVGGRPGSGKTTLVHKDKVLVRAELDKKRDKVDYRQAFGLCESGAALLVEGRPGSGKTTLVHKVTRDWSKGEVLVRAELDKKIDKVDYRQAFGRYESGALALVEGRPGSGKTTLVHKVTKDWSKGEKVLVGAEFVFMITLRILNVTQKDSNIDELMEQFYCSKSDVNNMSQYLLSSQGDKVCFILDGLDEYHRKNKGYKTVVEGLISGKLPKAMVIVASRPVGTSQLKQGLTIISSHIEILGFEKDQISLFIDSYFFPNTDMAQGLKEYLKEHMNVLHMCYLPVHTSMICYLYSLDGGNLPKTETEIYGLFAIHTITRKVLREDANIKEVASLDSLTAQSRVYFVNVCKLAFEMTSRSLQVLCGRDVSVQLCDELDSDGPSLGLVTVDHAAKVHGYENFYTFLHITFQEFLAAHYIHQLAREEQFVILNQYRNFESMIMVWKFYCGMTKLELNSELLNQISCIFDSEHADTLYKIHCAFESQQSIICDRVLESTDQGVLSFERKTFNLADYNAIGYVIATASHPTVGLEFHSCILDKKGVGRLLTSIGQDRLKFIKRFLFHFKRNSKDQLQAVNTILKSLSSLEFLDFCKTTLTEMEIIALTDRVTLPQLKCLKMPFIPICDNFTKVLPLLSFNSSKLESVYINPSSSKLDVIEVVQNTFTSCTIRGNFQNAIADLCNADLIHLNFNFFSCCTSLIFINCNIDDAIIDKVGQGLMNMSFVKKLALDYNKISGAGAAVLASSLQCLSTLKHLSIACNLIDDSGAEALASVLCQCTSLVHLNLEGNRIGDEGAMAIVEVVKVMNVELFLWNDKITEECIRKVWYFNITVHIDTPIHSDLSFALDAVSFTRAMKCCTTLPSIIYVNPYNDKKQMALILKALANQLPCFSNLTKLSFHALLDTFSHVKLFMEGLQSCSNMLMLDISENNIDSGGAVALVEGLKSCTNLQTLAISENNIGSDGVAALSQGLKFCTNLQTLAISENNIGSNGAAALSQGLKFCTNLRTLDISENNIASDGAAALSQGLKFCTNLRTLDISENNIGSNGAAALSQGLKFCTNLRTLDISENNIGSDGAAALAEGLVYCINLQMLNVSENNIGSVGAAALAKRLKSCTNLQTLGICWNNIGLSGAVSLAESLKSCANFFKLDVSYNNIDSDSVITLAQRFKFVLTF